MAITDDDAKRELAIANSRVYCSSCGVGYLQATHQCKCKRCGQVWGPSTDCHREIDCINYMRSMLRKLNKMKDKQ